MAFDPLSPVAPARVRVLLLPLGRIKRARFLSFVERLQQENVIRLGDISPDGRPNRNMFSPLAFPSGMLLYDLTTSLPPPSHLALSPFELHREPLAIVAIADGLELGYISFQGNSEGQVNGHRHSAQLRDLRELDQELEQLRDQYPKALVHQLLIFDFVQLSDSMKLPEGLIGVPSLAESNITTMKTVMCDISSKLLAEMTTSAKSFQAMTTIESPGKGLAARQTSGFAWPGGNPDQFLRRGSQHSLPDNDSGAESPTGKADRSHVRMSMPAQLPYRSDSISRPTTPLSGTGTPNNELSRTKSPEHHAVGRESFRDHSRDRISVQGFGSGSLSERSRNKGRGRITIIIGFLYLMAGRWGDAQRELIEGAVTARGTNDHLWHAKALEGIMVSMLMLAWAGHDFQIPQICYSTADKAPYHTPSASTLEQQVPSDRRLASLQSLGALLPELLDKILNLYERASNFAGESLPQLPFSETAIRFAKLLSILHLASGKFDDDALQLIVLGRVLGKPLPKLPNPNVPRPKVQPSRSLIVGMLFRAFPVASVTEDLTIIDRTIILGGIATILGILGYYRKKAMVMRELVAILIPGLVQARTVGAAEMGIHPAASLAELSSLNGSTNGAGALELGEGDFEDGMDDLLSLMGRVYGVVSFHSSSVESGKQTSPDEYDDSDDAAVARILANAKARAFGGQNIKMNVLRACINLAEALPDFRGVLRFTSDLLRTAGSGVAPGPHSEDASPFMTREEQVQLGNNIVRTVDAAWKLGLKDLEAEYWDEFLVRGVDLEAQALTRTPIPHRKTELGGTTSSSESKERNPFIYNPFLKRPDAAAVNRILVAGETAIFKITLQNPFEFDVDIESIRLESEGIEFDSGVQGTVIGPYRTQIMSITGVPQAEGKLTIKGCIVKVRGCRERRFPIFIEPWAPQIEVKIKAIGLGARRGQPERPVSTASGSKKPTVSIVGPKPASLSLTVIHAQPTVVVKSTSLPQAAAMILEGERQSFSVTLENLSKTTPVDLVLFSFQDSTQAPLQTALSNRDASPAELYEYELILLKKQAISWKKRDDENPQIPAGGTATFDLEILGKAGLTSATIQVDYAYLGVPREEVQDTFYTRQVIQPFTVTVNASVELARVDVLPLTDTLPAEWWPRVGDGDGEPSQLKPDDYCLLLLDLRNAWPSHLRVHLEAPGNRVIEEEVLPGNTSRIVFPIQRIFLDNPFAAIPALDPARQRQFVVSTGKISADTERATREAFWYREEILKTLKGTWYTTSGPQRSGDIELRGIRLSPRMIEAIKIEDIGIELELEGDHVTQERRLKGVVPVTSFFRIKTRITNRTSDSIYPFFRLQPALRHHSHNSALDLSKKLVWDGILQQPLPLLPSKESTEITIPMTALCRGEFEIGASVEEARFPDDSSEKGENDKEESGSGGRPRSNTKSLMDSVLGPRERRMWHTRESFVLQVIEDEDDD